MTLITDRETKTVIAIPTARLADGVPIIPALGALEVMHALAKRYPAAPYVDVEAMANDMTTGALATARALGSRGAVLIEHGITLRVYIEPIIRHGATWHDDGPATIKACGDCSHNYVVRSW